MTILFASNDPADFTGDFIIDTGAGRFRSANVDHGFQSGGDGGAPGTESLTQTNPPAAGDVTWYHAQMYHNANLGGNNATGKFWCTARDASGARIVTFFCGGTSGVLMRVYGTTNGDHVPAGQNNPFPTINTLMVWDLKIDLTAPNITVSLYRDKSLTAYFTATVTNNGKTNPVSLEWHAWDWLNSGSNYQQIGSEFIVADEDTREMGLSNKFTYSAGFHTAWDGPVADLSDEDQETGISVATTAKKVSRAIATYGGPASTSVRGVFLNLRGGVDGAVGDIRGLARKTSTDYVTSGAGFTEARASERLVGWDNDPNSAAAWDTADLTDFEFGVESIA